MTAHARRGAKAKAKAKAVRMVVAVVRPSATAEVDAVARHAPPPSRTRCTRCERPLAGCWCDCVRRVENPTALLILQHPDEAGQTKGTAGLLARCLTRVERLVGEQFTAPAHTRGMALLYPDTPDDPALPAATAWPSEPVHTLVVIDGTWRKSRRLLYRNPWLATLPRLSLVAAPPSRYSIRRAQAQDQRSTLEASALALAQLDGNEARYAPLWSAMDAFVELQERLVREGRARVQLGRDDSR